MSTRGMDNKLYLNTSLTETAAWVEMKDVKDLTINNEKALADASTRGSRSRKQRGTLKEVSIDFNAVDDEDDDTLQLFEDAYWTDATIDVCSLNGPISSIGSKGIRFAAEVTKFGGNQALEDMGLIDITLTPTLSSANDVRRVHIATAGTVADVT